MAFIKKMIDGKYAFILLFGIGVSNIGEWVYFLALNLIVYDITGSPLAVSLLYVIKPLATITTSFWGGTIIDRLNKKRLLIVLDMLRALLIVLLPLMMSSMVYLYLIVYIINMLSSMFSSTSIVYITKLIPKHKRKQFNSLHSLVTSGAFFTGPAIAGLLFLIGAPILAIYTNAVALFLSGLIMIYMPDLEEKTKNSENQKVSIKTVMNDWHIVLAYSRDYRYVMIIYFLFEGIMLVMASAVDSLEVAFAKEVLDLSDSHYGFLVSIAGIGILSGALLNTIIVNKIKINVLIGFGTLFVSIGYVTYSLSNSLLQAGIGFFILAFFTAYGNTGFLTFFQNSIPVEIMGRISSIYSLINAGFIILFTTLLGIMAEIFTIKITVIVGVFIMLLLSIYLLYVLSINRKSVLLIKQ
jgi:MFS family permease